MASVIDHPFVFVDDPFVEFALNNGGNDDDDIDDDNDDDEEEADLGEVEVIGDEDDDDDYDDDGGDDEYEIPDDDGDGDDGDGDGGDGGPASTAAPPVSHDGHPDSVAAASALAASLGPVTAAIAALADTASVPMPDGSTMTGAELKAQWNAMSFHVTSGQPYGSGRGGANHGSIVTIDSGVLSGYLAYGAAGANFLLLHEIAHSSPFGQTSNDAFWNEHQALGGNRADFRPGTTGSFERNEIVANRLARDLANLFQIDIPTGSPGFPTYGY